MIRQLMVFMMLMCACARLYAQAILFSEDAVLHTQPVEALPTQDNTSIENRFTESMDSASLVSKRKKIKYRKRAVKVDFVGLFRGFTQMSYEQYIKPGRSFEVGVGIIGLGKNGTFQYDDSINYHGEEHQNQHGFFISAGYKYNKLYLFQTAKPTETHILQGLYAKPILYWGTYTENRVAYLGNRKYGLEEATTTFGAFELEFGKEWVFANRWPIDIYWGVGYGIDNKQYYNTSYFNYTTVSAFNYCNDRVGKSPGISFTFGLKSGMLFR